MSATKKRETLAQVRAERDQALRLHSMVVEENSILIKAIGTIELNPEDKKALAPTLPSMTLALLREARLERDYVARERDEALALLQRVQRGDDCERLLIVQWLRREYSGQVEEMVDAILRGEHLLPEDAR